jgi:hypothetical protein
LQTRILRQEALFLAGLVCLEQGRRQLALVAAQAEGEEVLVLAGRAVGKPVVLVVVEPDPADRELFTPLFDAGETSSRP